MSDILAQAQEMQAKLQAAQEEIMSSIVIGQAGNGLVSVSMQGSGTVTSVNIDPKVIDPEDPDTLQEPPGWRLQRCARPARQDRPG